MNNKIIIITAPSGTGKSTLIQRIKKDFCELEESLSYTTRSKRKNESEGKSYYYISVDTFKKRIQKGDFLEWAKVHGNYYGTPKSLIKEYLQKGKNLLFDLDIQGADHLKQHFGHHATVIFIAPPSLKILEERLKRRATEPQEIINLRIKNAKKEMIRKNDFEYFLSNDDLEDTYIKLKDIVKEILGK